MALFFVDYASLGVGSIEGINKLDSNDTIYIYYNRFSKKLPIRMVECLRECKAEFIMKDMDMVIFYEPMYTDIASRIGNAIAFQEFDKIYVISRRRSLQELSIAKQHCSRVIFNSSIRNALLDSETNDNGDDSEVIVDNEQINDSDKIISL